MSAKTDINSNQSVKICHISDFHLPLEDVIPIHKLLSKRVMGYANLKLLRSKTHIKEPFLKLLEQISKEKPDLLVATGDLVNLALDAEYKLIADIFDQFGFTKENLMLVPGNHDRYTPGSQYKAYFEKAFSKWLDCDGSPPCYPYVKKFDNVAVIGLDTAVWRGPVSAAGRINKKQLEKLEQILTEECENRQPVIAMHHPPCKLLGSHFKHSLSGLYGYRKILDLLKDKNALVLHGHIHIRTNFFTNDTHIVGVPSASNDHESSHKKMSFHTFNFDKNGNYNMSSTTYHSGENRFETKILNKETD